MKTHTVTLGADHWLPVIEEYRRGAKALREYADRAYKQYVMGPTAYRQAIAHADEVDAYAKQMLKSLKQ